MVVLVPGALKMQPTAPCGQAKPWLSEKKEDTLGYKAVLHLWFAVLAHLSRRLKCPLLVWHTHSTIFTRCVSAWTRLVPKTLTVEMMQNAFENAMEKRGRRFDRAEE